MRIPAVRGPSFLLAPSPSANFSHDHNSPSRAPRALADVRIPAVRGPSFLLAPSPSANFSHDHNSPSRAPRALADVRIPAVRGPSFLLAPSPSANFSHDHNSPSRAPRALADVRIPAVRGPSFLLAPSLKNPRIPSIRFVWVRRFPLLHPQPPGLRAGQAWSGAGCAITARVGGCWPQRRW